MQNGLLSKFAEGRVCGLWSPIGCGVYGQKGAPGTGPGSAMRSGKGTLRFFYVACDHGWRDALSWVCWGAHLYGCLSRGEVGLGRASGFRQAIRDR